jgi:AcrR family transcriptional regulator
MTETPSRRERQREERSQQILDAAVAVFSQKGYHTANVSDVAAKAGVSQGTIYWYFESKEELLTAALLSYSEGFGEQAIAALDDCPTSSGKLRALSEGMVGIAEDAEGLLSLFVGYWQSTSRREEASRLWTDLLGRYKDVAVGVTEAGIRDGEFTPVDGEALVWALMAAYDGLAAYQMLIPDLDLRRISLAFVEVLLSGLRPRDRDSS